MQLVAWIVLGSNLELQHWLKARNYSSHLWKESLLDHLSEPKQLFFLYPYTCCLVENHVTCNTSQLNVRLLAIVTEHIGFLSFIPFKLAIRILSSYVNSIHSSFVYWCELCDSIAREAESTRKWPLDLISLCFSSWISIYYTWLIEGKGLIMMILPLIEL